MFSLLFALTTNSRIASDLSESSRHSVFIERHYNMYKLPFGITYRQKSLFLKLSVVSFVSADILALHIYADSEVRFVDTVRYYKV